MTPVLSKTLTSSYTGDWIYIPAIGRSIQSQLVIQGYWKNYNATDGSITISGSLYPQDADLYDTISTIQMSSTNGHFTVLLEPYGLRAYRISVNLGSGSGCTIAAYDNRGV